MYTTTVVDSFSELVAVFLGAMLLYNVRVDCKRNKNLQLGPTFLLSMENVRRRELIDAFRMLPDLSSECIVDALYDW